MSGLKAYQVQDDYEGHAVIVFATNSATARREGASELDTEWEGIDFCRRMSALDAYAPGPVPPLVLLSLGWWFECAHHGCQRRVERESYDDDEPPIDPVAEGQSIYCSPECRGRERARRTGNKRARNALCELVYTKFPDASIVNAHVYGEQLEKSTPGYGLLSSASFLLPGLTYPAHLNFGDPNIYVSQCDADTFQQRYGVRAAA